MEASYKVRIEKIIDEYTVKLHTKEKEIGEFKQ